MAEIGTEHEELEKARNGFLMAEKHLRRAIKALSNIQTINTNADRHEASNAAFCTKALTQSALGTTQWAHGKGTEYLFKHWPEEAVPAEDGGVIVRSSHR